MPSTTYVYTISSNFSGVTPCSSKLLFEIKVSAISTTLDCINTDGDNVSIIFVDALSAGNKTILDGIVSAHTPTIPVPYSYVTGSVTTNSTDSYQTVNTLNFMIVSPVKCRLDWEYLYSSTLVGNDIKVTLDDVTIDSNTTAFGLGLQGSRSSFIIQDMTFGNHSLKIQFRRSNITSATTIRQSKLLVTTIEL